MMKKLQAIIVLSFTILLYVDASAMNRRNLLDGINHGLKLIGKNSRTNQEYIFKRTQLSGVSNKVADLVSETFSPDKKNQNKNRQETVNIGTMAEGISNNSLISGVFKLLGFDGEKIGAAALNGVIFIASMVRYGATKLFGFLLSKSADLLSKSEIFHSQLKNDSVSSVLKSANQYVDNLNLKYVKDSHLH